MTFDFRKSGFKFPVVSLDRTFYETTGSRPPIGNTVTGFSSSKADLFNLFPRSTEYRADISLQIGNEW